MLCNTIFYNGLIEKSEKLCYNPNGFIILILINLHGGLKMKKNVKRAAVILMAVLMLVTAIPMNGIVGTDLFASKASAAELAPTGQCGENAYWTFDSETGLLTISGTGEMNDYSYNRNSPFYNNTLIKNITIEDGITNVGEYLFSECRYLISVSIPNSVTTICGSAFRSCSKLSNVNMSNGVKCIGRYAFYGCSSLENIIIPNSVTTICEDAFRSCSKLSNVNMSNGVKCIERCAFYGCSSLENITIPTSVNSIKQCAFQGTKLTKITIPDSVTEIERNIFQDCYHLTEIRVSPDNKVFDSRNNCNAIIETKTNTLIAGCKNSTIPNTVKSIGNCAFFTCKDLKSIDIPDSVTSIGGSAFWSTGLSDVIIPNTVTSIGYNAFTNCTNLRSIILPDNLTGIGNNLFDGCESLTDLVLPDGIKSIGESAFMDCIELTTLKLPDSLTTIAMSAFRNSGLTSITIPANVYLINNTAFSECTELNNISVDEKNQSYDSRNNCNAIIRTSDNVLMIGCKNTVIPDDVSTIGNYAFAYLTDLAEIIIPESVTKIGEGAFYKCTNLSDVYYSGSESQWNDIIIDSNNDYLLNANIHFNYVETTGTCGENINWTYDESNGNLVISGTGAMDSYDSFDDYGWYSFKDDIKFVEVSDGITSIGANAFNGCTALKEVYFGKNTAAIGENAFADCTNLSIVTVTSDSFTAENAFSNNSSRLTFVVADGNTSAESFAKNSGYPVITAGYSDEENTVYFKGNTIVYKSLQYNYLTNYINEYSYAEYIHFDRLEFDGIMPDVIFIEDCENIVSGTKNFALNDLYVSLKVVVDGREEQITFEKMFELLESGNYDAFKLKFQSESGETEESFFEKVVEFFDNFFTSALSAISRAINTIVKLFKKK